MPKSVKKTTLKKPKAPSGTKPQLKKTSSPKYQEESNSKKLADLMVKKKSLEAEYKDWQNKAMRYAAEIQNLQKQHDIDVAAGRKKTKKHVLETLLPFLDSINLAFSYIPQTDDEAINKFVSALKGSWNKLRSDLQLINAELIIPEKNQKVDPDTMSIVNPNPQIEEPKVIGVVSLGLRIDDVLVKPSSVMIA